MLKPSEPTSGMTRKLTTQDASYCFPNFGRKNALKKERHGEGGGGCTDGSDLQIHSFDLQVRSRDRHPLRDDKHFRPPTVKVTPSHAYFPRAFSCVRRLVTRACSVFRGDKHLLSI